MYVNVRIELGFVKPMTADQSSLVVANVNRQM